MKIQTANSEEIVLEITARDQNHHSFFFDVTPVVEGKAAKNVVILWRGRWEMSWRKFLKQPCVGDIATIKKSQFDKVK